MSNYYNEWEPYAADWLRNLIKKGLIPDGQVDTRSIVDVRPDDLRGFTQCHFFAGLGGFPLALRLAGWSQDREIWTGSCPCQPFSTAGQGKGTADERHLWPELFRLISACRPAYAIGEQVAAKAGLNWLDGVFDDLESQNYSCQAVNLSACSVNAPHIRERLYWFGKNMGVANSAGWDKRQPTSTSSRHGSATISGSCDSGKDNMEDTAINGCQQRWKATASEIQGECSERGGQFETTRTDGQLSGGTEGLYRSSLSSNDMGDTISEGLEGHPGDGDGGNQPGWLTAYEDRPTTETSSIYLADTESGASGDVSKDGRTTSGEINALINSDSFIGRDNRPGHRQSISEFNFWQDAIWLRGADGKTRRAPTSRSAESNVCCLVDGFWYRVDDVLAQIARETLKEVEIYASKAGRDRKQILPLVRNYIYEKEICANQESSLGENGGQIRLQQTEILLNKMWDILSTQEQSTAFSCDFEEESTDNEEAYLRGLRSAVSDICASLRRKPNEQFAGKSSDPLLALSQFLAQCGEKAWEISVRQDASALLIGNMKHRASALKALGNAIVPQLAAEFIKSIIEAEE